MCAHNFPCVQCRGRPVVGNYCMQLGSRWVSVNTFWPGSTIWHPMTPACRVRPGYLREPHWNSIEAPGNIQGNADRKNNFVIFGSGNGLSPLRYQAITQTKDILFSWSKVQNTKQNCSNFHSLILFQIYDRGVYLRISRTKWPSCSSLCVLRSSTLHT